MKRRQSKPAFVALALVALLVAGLLAACGDENQPPAKIYPTPANGVGAGNGVGAVPGGPGPTRGADGQITVVAPPPTGQNIQGQIFWVKDSNIWQGGAGTPAVPPVTQRDLGGKQLTKGAALAIATSPALSPDGTQMIYAFSPEPEGDAGNIIIGQDLYLLDLKTGTSKLFLKRDEPQGYLDNPAFSSDGKFLYFDSRVTRRDAGGQIVGENISLVRYEFATGKRETLLMDAKKGTPLADGKRVLYIETIASSGSYETALKLYDLQTRQSTTVAGRDKGFVALAWARPSPDGKLIVFSSAGGPDYFTPTPGGQTGQPSGQKTTGRASAPLGLMNFSLSLGHTSAINKPATSTAVHGIPFDLWLIKADGSDLKRLTSLFEDEPQPSWASDGQSIAFLGGQGLYKIGVDGKGLSKLSDRGGHQGFVWRS